jgi:hypothetical protein
MNSGMYKTAMVSAFVDELQKIASSRGRRLSEEEILYILKEAGVLQALGQGAKALGRGVARGAQAVGSGIKNQYNDLNVHIGDAMAHAGPHGMLNPTMPVHGIGPAMQGATSFLSSKMPGRVGRAVAGAAGEALPASPVTAGIKPALQGAFHGLTQGMDHVAPGLGSLAAQAGSTLASGALARGARRLVPAASGVVGHAVKQVV